MDVKGAWTPATGVHEEGGAAAGTQEGMEASAVKDD